MDKKYYVKFDISTKRIIEFAPKNKDAISNYNSLDNNEMLLQDGYSYEEVEAGYDGTYIKGFAPLKPFNILKSEKLSLINPWREQARQNEFAVYNSRKFGIRESDQSNITSQVSIAQLMVVGAIPEKNQDLRDVDNITHSFSPQEIIAAGLCIGFKVAEIYRKSWEMKESVENLKEDTPENRAILENLHW